MTVIRAAESSADFHTLATSVPAVDRVRTGQIATSPFGYLAICRILLADVDRDLSRPSQVGDRITGIELR